MSILGFYDARDLADIVDCRASTIRALADEGSDLIPPPCPMFDDSSIHLWPEAAIEAWVKQGSPTGWTYDAQEFRNVALRAWKARREETNV